MLIKRVAKVKGKIALGLLCFTSELHVVRELSVQGQETHRNTTSG